MVGSGHFLTGYWSFWQQQGTQPSLRFCPLTTSMLKTSAISQGQWSTFRWMSSDGLVIGKANHQNDKWTGEWWFSSHAVLPCVWKDSHLHLFILHWSWFVHWLVMNFCLYFSGFLRLANCLWKTSDCFNKAVNNQHLVCFQYDMGVEIPLPELFGSRDFSTELIVSRAFCAEIF